MSEKTTDTNIDTVNSRESTEAKIDLEKVRKYEEQVIESVESAGNNEVNLSKDDTVDHNQHYQQSYQQQQYQQNNNQQQQQQQQQHNNQQQQQQQQQQHYLYPQNIGIVTPDKLALEPTLACLVSVLVVGLGQMINGQIEKGLILLFGGMLAVTAISLITCGFGAIISPLLIVISALDAYNCAKRLQMGQSIGKYEFHIFG